MSVILVKKYKDKVILGSDTQETSGESGQENINFSKIRKINDSVWIACAGNAHVASLLYAYAEVNDMTEITKSIQLISYFKNFFDWVNEIIIPIPDMINPCISCQFIIVVNNKVWNFNNYYLRDLDENEVSSIGIGSQSALACMKITDSVETALTAVCDTDIYCSLPLNIIEIKL